MTAQETSLSNFFETTLNGIVASGATSATLTAAPTSDGTSNIAAPYYLVIDPDSSSNREVVLVTAASGTTLSTITRDVEGRHTTDPTHVDGTTVRMSVIKEMFDDTHDRINDIALTGDITGTLASATQDIATTIANNAVETDMINADAVTEAKIADNAVESEHINDNVISGQTELASGLALTDELLVSDAGTVKRMDVSLIADAIDGDGIDVSSGTLVNAAIGKQSMWVPAAAMYPTQSNGCASITGVETTAGRPDMYVLDFDASSDENAQFSIAMPSYWNEGTITFQVYWTTAATDTDGVAWALSGVVCSDNDTIDAAFGTAVVVTDDALGAAEDLCVTAESAAVTLAGTPAAGDLAYFNIMRDVSDANDDMTEDARLIGVKIFYTVDDVHEA